MEKEWPIFGLVFSEELNSLVPRKLIIIDEYLKAINIWKL